ncbi:MAG TPA: hypothetical protein VGD49_09965, partial [Longimicrobiales bacterium]
MSEFCAVRFGRGMGFGNRLYPWARCHLFSLRDGVPMLAPRWWWPPRVTPLLQAPPPLREWPGHLYVHGIRPLPEYIDGVRRAWIMATSRRNIRFFHGEAGRFRDLAGAHNMLHDALRRMSTTAPVTRDQPYIAAHVRRGDFGAATADDLRSRGGLRTPTSWFIAAVRAIRDGVGRSIPVRVVSDGSAGELKELLAEPDVELVRTGAPLGDLLSLAHARVLLASGSSFSAWGCFLGGMPAATHPGQSLAWFGVQQ